MSDLVQKKNTDLFQTPEKTSKMSHSIKQIYLTSFKKDCSRQQMCLLCLQCSSDCNGCRCFNSEHIVCKECACQWEIDKVCPVCKNNSYKTIKKLGSKYSTPQNSDDNSKIKWQADLPEIESSQDLQEIDSHLK